MKPKNYEQNLQQLFFDFWFSPLDEIDNQELTNQAARINHVSDQVVSYKFLDYMNKLKQDHYSEILERARSLVEKYNTP